MRPIGPVVGKDGGFFVFVLADDQAISRIIIKKFLKDVGLEVVEANDGSKLLEIYRNSLDDKGKTNIDIIIYRY